MLQFFQEIGEIFGQSLVFVTLLLLDPWFFLKYLQQCAVCHRFDLFKLKPSPILRYYRAGNIECSSDLSITEIITHFEPDHFPHFLHANSLSWHSIPFEI